MATLQQNKSENRMLQCDSRTNGGNNVVKIQIHGNSGSRTSLKTECPQCEQVTNGDDILQ